METTNKEGTAMTKWWLQITFYTTILTNGYELFSKYTGSKISSNIYWFQWIKGTCAISAACVSIGYYIFMFLFNSLQRPTLHKQFYDKTWKENPVITFYTYLYLDFFVHTLCCGGVFLLWIHNISVISALLTFVFHRLWSLVHSEWTTSYFCGDNVYQFNEKVPIWVWYTIYGIENSICLCSLLYAMNYQKYY